MVKKISVNTRFIACLTLFGCLITSSISTAAVQVIPKGFNKSSSSSAKDTQISEAKLKANFTKAVKAYRKELRSYWPDAE